MSVDVTLADEGDLEKWNDYVGRAHNATPFHRLEALEVVAAHSGAKLHPLIGRKGQEPVGLFPLFELSRGPATVAFSPPPDLRVSYLGPALLNMGKLKRRKAERRLRSFVDGCFAWLREQVTPWYLHVRTDHRYEDVRPFKWNDCTVTPNYTYLIPLESDESDLLARFSSDARRNVRDSSGGSNADRDFEVAEGGGADVERILDQVRGRYESQGIPFHLANGFVRDLYTRLPDGIVRPYVCRVDGEFVGGILALEDDDTVYRWQGGVRTNLDVDVPVNDLLDWHVMTDARKRGVGSYDLVGADTPRINRYKAKFGPELATFYSVEGGSPPARFAASLYQRVRK